MKKIFYLFCYCLFFILFIGGLNAAIIYYPILNDKPILLPIFLKEQLKDQQNKMQQEIEKTAASAAEQDSRKEEKVEQPQLKVSLEEIKDSVVEVITKRKKGEFAFTGGAIVSSAEPQVEYEFSEEIEQLSEQLIKTEAAVKKESEKKVETIEQPEKSEGITAPIVQPQVSEEQQLEKTVTITQEKIEQPTQQQEVKKEEVITTVKKGEFIFQLTITPLVDIAVVQPEEEKIEFSEDIEQISQQIVISYIRRQSPNQNSIVRILNPEFAWDNYQSAEKYQLYISRIPFSPNNLILSKELKATNYVFSTSDAIEELKDKTNYAWLVVALDKNENIISKTDVDAISYFSIELPVVIKKDEVREDTQLEIVEIEQQPNIVEIMINNKPIDSYQKGEYLCRDNLLDDRFLISFSANNLSNVKILSITIDGNNYQNITFEKKTAQQKLEYSYRPTGDAVLKFAIKIQMDDDKWLTEDYFNELYINYTHKTNNQLINMLLDNFCQAILNGDNALFMSCISENFSGNFRGYRDYNEINDTIKREFRRSTTSLCSASNRTIVLNSPTRGEVTFQFRRNMYFTDIDIPKGISVLSKFDVIKENGVWKIMTDRTGLNFKAWFPTLPSPPDL